MNIKTYCNIDNAYQEKTIQQIQLQGFDKVEWIGQNKIHGTNFGANISQNGVVLLKHTGKITPEMKFFNAFEVFETVKASYLELAKEVGQEITIYGELAGGTYPHPNVKPIPNCVRVQNGIYYAPFNFIYAFDLYLHEQNKFMNMIELEKLFSKYGILHAQTLVQGTLRECLAYPNNYSDPMHKYWSLPEIEGNETEGVVLKPVDCFFFDCGSRVILKNKNPKWSEKVFPGTHKIIKPNNIPMTEKAAMVCEGLFALVTENRLKNVISHIGSITNKDFGKLSKAMHDDVYEEYKKDNQEEFDSLEKTEQKIISKRITTEVMNMIRSNFVNIIDGMF